MNVSTSTTITPVRVADLLAEGGRMPVYVHVIDHPDTRVLVDSGMTELHPAVAELDPRLQPLSRQDFDLAGTDIVVNTHLHSITAAATTSSRASQFTSSVGSSRTPGTRTTTPFASGSMRPACGTYRSTASSSCFPGSGLSPRRATHAGCRSSSSRRAGGRSSLAATWRFGLASKTSHAGDPAPSRPHAGALLGRPRIASNCAYAGTRCLSSSASPMRSPSGPRM
jgi:hypothetical protein